MPSNGATTANADSPKNARNGASWRNPKTINSAPQTTKQVQPPPLPSPPPHLYFLLTVNPEQKTLKTLREKATSKNPDEFYFAMLSRRGPTTSGKRRTGTVSGDRGNAVLSQEAARLFKTQDMGYIRTLRNQTLKEVKGLEERVGAWRGEKTVWVGDEEELELRVQEGEWEVEAEEERTVEKGERELKKVQGREREKVERMLGVARERARVLGEAEEALGVQRARMGKSEAVGGVNREGVKFKVKDRKR